MANDSTLYASGFAIPETYWVRKFSLSETSATSQANNITFPISIYPNPSHEGMVWVDTDYLKGLLTVTDINGQFISAVEVQGKGEVALPNTGTYFITFSNKEFRFTKKVIFAL